MRKYRNQVPVSEEPGLMVEINADRQPEKLLPDDDTGRDVIRVHYLCPTTGKDYFSDWDVEQMPDDERAFCRQRGIDVEPTTPEAYISQGTREAGRQFAQED